jgi:O-methyltransferase domain
MTKTAKLLVIEMVIPPGNEACYSKLLDLMMLVGPGGCDRTEAEYEALFEAGGLLLTKVIPTQSPAGVIEGIPE